MHFLGAIKTWNRCAQKVQILERLARGNQGGIFCQWVSDGFRNEWHGSAGSRVGFEHKHLSLVNRVLAVHQAVHTNLERQFFGVRMNFLEQFW